jgi:hypothetical protein
MTCSRWKWHTRQTSSGKEAFSAIDKRIQCPLGEDCKWGKVSCVAMAFCYNRTRTKVLDAFGAVARIMKGKEYLHRSNQLILQNLGVATRLRNRPSQPFWLHQSSRSKEGLDRPFDHFSPFPTLYCNLMMLG